jgi:hypothetical protein
VRLQGCYSRLRALSYLVDTEIRLWASWPEGKGLLPAAQLFSFCLFLKSGPVHTATPWPGPEGGGDDYSAFPQLGPKFYILALSFPLSIKTNSGNWGPIGLSDSIGTTSIN